MSEERRKVLQMLAEGKITPEDAERLLAKLEGGSEETTGGRPDEPRRRGRFLRIEVDGPDRETVNVRVPLGFLRAGLKLGTVVPSRVRERLADRGIDLGAIPTDDADEFLKALEDLDVQIEDGDKGNVRIYAE